MKESGISWSRRVGEIDVAGVHEFLHDSHGRRSVHRIWGETQRVGEVRVEVLITHHRELRELQLLLLSV